jgi:hypothetical protein
VQTGSRQHRPAVLSTTPATPPVDSNVAGRDVELPGNRYAQKNGPELKAVAVSCQPVSLRTSVLGVVEQRQMRRTEIVNPAGVHFA